MSLAATPAAAPGPAPGAGRAPLRIGPHQPAVPVVLAPMAGITNVAYRTLCREQAEAGLDGTGAGRSGLGDPDAGPAALFVCEMITARGLVERDPKTLSMLSFDAGERVRSVQLYGVDPRSMGQATDILCGEFGVTHVDLNFGCPVPKITRKGGGGALPWKRDLLAAILTSTVTAAGRYQVPVTAKTRMGIDADHLTYLDAGRIAEDTGVAAIALHGRTVAQSYSGQADWEAIARLVDHVDIPVLGNGDVWEAADAETMLARTGAAGVVVGRGCLGRPWLFHDLSRTLSGRPGTRLPTLGAVATTLRRHAELLAEVMGEGRGLADLRKHMAWYLKGYPVGSEVRRGLAMVASLAELDGWLAQLDPDAPFPSTELGAPRGRRGHPRSKVALPQGWLDDTCGTDLDLAEAEQDVSGG